MWEEIYYFREGSLVISRLQLLNNHWTDRKFDFILKKEKTENILLYDSLTEIRWYLSYIYTCSVPNLIPDNNHKIMLKRILRNKIIIDMKIRLF